MSAHVAAPAPCAGPAEGGTPFLLRTSCRRSVASSARWSPCLGLHACKSLEASTDVRRTCAARGLQHLRTLLAQPRTALER